MDKFKKNLDEDESTKSSNENFLEFKEESMNEEEFRSNASISYIKRNILNTIKDGIERLQNEINLDKYIANIPDSRTGMNYYFETLYEYPELFYSDLNVRCVYRRNNSGVILSYTLKVSYIYNKEEIPAKKIKFESKVNSIQEQYLSKVSNSLEKEYVVYDYLLENCIYDTSEDIPVASHTSYSVFLIGKAVCDGYSKAVKVLLDRCGIDSGIVLSDSMAHAWNYIKMNNQYYFLDITWDDTSSDTFNNRYNYFNTNTNEMIKERHTWATSDYPSSTSTTFCFLRDYYSIVRLNSTLYCYDKSNATLYKMTLDGKNKTIVRSEFYYNTDLIMTGYDNNLYYTMRVYYQSTGVTSHMVIRYNLAYKSEKIIFETPGKIEKMYKENSNLIIEYKNSKSTSTISKKIISLKIECDTNSDGIVDEKDLKNIAAVYNRKSGENGYIEAMDFNKDGIIDIYDIVKISVKF